MRQKSVRDAELCRVPHGTEENCVLFCIPSPSTVLFAPSLKTSYSHSDDDRYLDYFSSPLRAAIVIPF